MTAAAIDPRTPPHSLLARFGPDADAPPPTRDQALDYVRGLATTHYENFSVLSRLVPTHLRDDFAAVYAFCRWADDLADETGNDAAARQRSLELLAWWKTELRRCFAAAEASAADEPRHPVYLALLQTVKRHRPPIQPFADLIDAFEQDQRITRYETWDQLLDYCRRSANPVGRIVLHLGGWPDTPANAERYRKSDATCTALQLINFWQDVRRDLLERDRIYIPSADTGITAEQLHDWVHRAEDPSARIPFIRALRPLVQRTRRLFDEGRDLPRLLAPDPSRGQSEIRPVVWLFGAGGRAVLCAVERAGCATLWDRRKLGGVKKATLVGQAWLSFRLHSVLHRRGAASAPVGAHA